MAAAWQRLVVVAAILSRPGPVCGWGDVIMSGEDLSDDGGSGGDSWDGDDRDDDDSTWWGPRDSEPTRRGVRHVVPAPTSPGPTLPPVFDPLVPTNLTVTAAKTAVMACVVHNLGNNSVAWIRHRDLQILSVGSVTYTNDGRFQAVPDKDQATWVLRLQYAAPKDSGQYDCQVSSTPPVARTLHLTVVEPQARILSAPEMHVGVGSPLNLTCVVPYSPQPPDYLHWYYKEQMVRGDGRRVWVRTQLGRRSVSQLLVHDARPDDQGVYTCSPANSLEHSVTVHVLTGEYPAAMQGGSSLSCQGRRRRCLVTVVALALLTGLYM